VPTDPVTPDTPTDPEPPAEPTPPPSEDVTQIEIGVLEVIELGVGDCTGVNLIGTVVGCEPETSGPVGIEIVLPGLPPLGL
jgi:hypothetical protein